MDNDSTDTRAIFVRREEHKSRHEFALKRLAILPTICYHGDKESTAFEVAVLVAALASVTAYAWAITPKLGDLQVQMQYYIEYTPNKELHPVMHKYIDAIIGDLQEGWNEHNR